MVRFVYFFGSTTLDSFLLTAAGCLRGAMPVYVYGLDQRGNLSYFSNV